MANEKNKPVYQTREEPFSASVFKNDKGLSINLQKWFKGKDGKLEHQQITVFPKQLLAIRQVLNRIKEELEASPEKGV